MKTIADIDLPKEFIKKKKIKLYKAFILKDGEEMDVNINCDIFSISHEDAVQYLINSLSYEEARALEHKTVNFAIFTFNTSDLIDKSLIDDEDEPYVKDGSLSLTLKDKLYNIDIEDKSILELDITFNPTNEIKTISKIVFQ